MAYSANGTTVKWPDTSTTLGQPISVARPVSAAKIRVTNLSSTRHIYEAGLPENEVTISINGIGNTAIEVGDTGVLTIAWNSGDTSSLSNMVVINNEPSGAVDGAITSNITFAPIA